MVLDTGTLWEWGNIFPFRLQGTLLNTNLKLSEQYSLKSVKRLRLGSVAFEWFPASSPVQISIILSRNAHCNVTRLKSRTSILRRILKLLIRKFKISLSLFIHFILSHTLEHNYVCVLWLYTTVTLNYIFLKNPLNYGV